jgi:hypothetical protein
MVVINIIPSQNSWDMRIEFDGYLTGATSLFAWDLSISIWILFLVVLLAPGQLA